MTSTARFIYDQCMTTRQALIRMWIATPADATTLNWVGLAAPISARTVLREQIRTWVENGRARLRAGRLPQR